MIKSIAFLSLLLCSNALAETWVTINATSYHVNPDKKYNEQNYGLGIEHHHAIDGLPVVFFAGAFHNSAYKTSVYGLVGIMPVSFSVFATNVKMGVFAGAVNGYPKMNDGRFIPAAMGIVNIGFTNIMIIPPTRSTPLTLGLQFKFK